MQRLTPDEARRFVELEARPEDGVRFETRADVGSASSDTGWVDAAGRCTGLWIHEPADGTWWSMATNVCDVQHGVSAVMSESDGIVRISFVVDGRADGDSWFFDAAGMLESSLTPESASCPARLTFFHDNGSMSATGDAVVGDDEITRTGTWTLLDPTGDVVVSGTIDSEATDDDWIIDGVGMELRPDGTWCSIQDHVTSLITAFSVANDAASGPTQL